MDLLHLTTLPPEILCTQLSYITDPKDIKSIINIHNSKLYNLLPYCVVALTRYNEYIYLTPLEVHRLMNLRVLTADIIARSQYELELISTLPYLETAIIHYIPNYSFRVDDVKEFIKMFCLGTYKLNTSNGEVIINNKRNFLGKNIILQYRSYRFEIKNNNPILSQLENKSFLVNSSLIDFLSFYREYTPLPIFDLSWIDSLLSPSSYDIDIIINFLKDIPELKAISTSEVILNFTELKVIRILFPKLTGLYYNPKEIIAARYHNVILNIFPSSSSITVFNLPIRVTQIQELLQKYPNVKEILVVMKDLNFSFDEVEKLLSYPQIEIINLATPYGEFIPDNPKIRVIKI
jgi:hypothetical protein